MPVEFSYQPRNCRLVIIRHVVVFDGIDIDDDIKFRSFGHSHRRALVLEQDVFFLYAFGNDSTGRCLLNLQRTALQKVDRIIAVIGNIDRKFGIDRIIVFILDAS